jgi:hypothetical protein
MMRIKNLVAAVAVGALLLVGIPTVVSTEVAQAATASDFKPGNIISDAQFYNGSAMDASSVQNFLNSQVPICRSSYACLTTYRQSTPTMAASAGRCDTYPGSGNESAADIIAKVGRACGISQKAMLVLLEKEQSLVTMSNPSQGRFESATGMGCPDTAPCDSSVAGFFYQVYYAARQFKIYSTSPNSFNHIAGRDNIVRFSPNAACGSSTVYIENLATAGLYNYTPYQPNAAALSNLYGSGDSCSAYGNRNFWRIYTDWFGSTTEPVNPAGSIDEFSVSQSSTGATLTVRGWTLDLKSSSKVIEAHVYLTKPDGSTSGTALRADKSRPDIGNAYPGAGANHGYQTTIPVSAGGSYQACVYGIGLSGNNRLLDCKSVTIAQNNPQGSLDGLEVTGKGATTAFAVRGWTFDPNIASTAIEAHVYITYPDGTRKGTALKANQARPDVSAVYPAAGPNHGFSSTFPISQGGTYEVCVYGIGTYWANKGANAVLGCQTFNLPSAYPLGSVDSVGLVQDDKSANIAISGWTFDTGALSTAIPVHVYLTKPDGTTSGYPFVANKQRDDVNRVYGSGPNHGFSEAIPITAPGVYKACVFGIAVSPLSDGKNSLFSCTTIDASAANPIGSFDSAAVVKATDGTGALTVAGWSIDQQVPALSTQVHVYVTGPDGVQRGTALVANKTRTDVGRVYPGTGTTHGFTDTLRLSQPGTYSVCAFAIGTARLSAGRNTLMECKTVSY